MRNLNQQIAGCFVNECLKKGFSKNETIEYLKCTDFRDTDSHKPTISRFVNIFLDEEVKIRKVCQAKKERFFYACEKLKKAEIKNKVQEIIYKTKVGAGHKAYCGYFRLPDGSIKKGNVRIKHLTEKNISNSPVDCYNAVKKGYIELSHIYESYEILAA